MIQIEYLITGLRIDVINHKLFTEQQKKELIDILDTCPTIPMSINMVKVTKAGFKVKVHLNTYEERYLSFGGNPGTLKTIRDDYARILKNAMNGYKNMRN